MFIRFLNKDRVYTLLIIFLILVLISWYNQYNDLIVERSRILQDLNQIKEQARVANESKQKIIVKPIEINSKREENLSTSLKNLIQFQSSSTRLYANTDNFLKKIARPIAENHNITNQIQKIEDNININNNNLNNNNNNINNNINDVNSVKPNVKIFDLNQNLDPVFLYESINCRKSARIYVETTLCIHDQHRDVFVSSKFNQNSNSICS
jgi:hypothetical protein